jgi:hypothetical protein
VTDFLLERRRHARVTLVACAVLAVSRASGTCAEVLRLNRTIDSTQLGADRWLELIEYLEVGHFPKFDLKA